MDDARYSAPNSCEAHMKVLALSQTYEPLGVIAWEKAINLIFTDKVYTLAEYERTVHSPSRSFRVPSVIVFKQNKKNRVKSVRFSRRNVWIRDEGRCQYCGQHVPHSNFTLDHVIPKTRGGTTCWANVVACCSPCNQKKGDKNLQQVGMRLLKPVVKPASLPYVQDVEFYFNYGNNLPEEWKFWLGEKIL